jgi:hypothetical protein
MHEKFRPSAVEHSFFATIASMRRRLGVRLARGHARGRNDALARHGYASARKSEISQIRALPLQGKVMQERAVRQRPLAWSFSGASPED